MLIRAKLKRTKVADHTWVFDLVLSGDLEKTFYLARIKDGSMTLVHYEITLGENGHAILSALFYVNIMGHDLDQRIDFDLATGEQIPANDQPRQALGSSLKRPGSSQPSRERRSVKKLRSALEKWGRTAEADEEGQALK